MTCTIHFTKAEGAQNDFVIVDDRSATLDDDTRRRFTRRISHRRRGAGADGAIFIDEAVTHDFSMAFYNPDGSVGSMCGNGGRCAALYALVNGIATSPMRFTVLGVPYAAEVDGTQVRLSFPPPLQIERDIVLENSLGTMRADYIDNGAPHLLLFTDDLPAELQTTLAGIDLTRIAAELRHHERFAPRGCNINIVELDAGGVLSIRTFEKGVEAETEACGTGTLAAGMMAHLRFGLSPPLNIRTHGGDILRIHFTPTSPTPHDAPAYFSRDLLLEGPAVLVFDGCYSMNVD
ncbi:MAG: diaminopimelate epimerase [Bacteroidetes bacterium]|nr:diaminopimelate epimerase [Bacteroidota bacterium]